MLHLHAIHNVHKSFLRGDSLEAGLQANIFLLRPENDSLMVSLNGFFYQEASELTWQVTQHNS